MRRAFAGLIWVALSVGASHGSAGVCPVTEFWLALPSQGKPLPRNAHVLVEATGPYVRVLDPVRTSVDFVTKGSIIRGHAVKSFEGAHKTMQWLYAPETALQANARYYLSFRAAAAAPIDRDAEHALAIVNERMSSAFGFSTLADRDDVAPRWQQAPTAGAYSYSTEKGSVFDNAFNVRVPLGKDFSGFILAHIENRTKPGAALDVLFAVETERTRIGQLGCISMFEPTRGLYSVSVSAIDFGGNTMNAPGKPLTLWFEKS